MRQGEGKSPPSRERAQLSHSSAGHRLRASPSLQRRAELVPELRDRPGHCGQLDTAPGTESRPAERSGHRRDSRAVTEPLKCHSRCWHSIGSYAPRHCSGILASTAGERLHRALRTAQPEPTGATRNQQFQSKRCFHTRSLPKALLPQAGPSSREIPSLPLGPGAAGTRACPPFFCLLRIFSQPFPGLLLLRFSQLLSNVTLAAASSILPAHPHGLWRGWHLRLHRGALGGSSSGWGSHEGS